MGERQSRAALLSPAGLCQGIAMRSSPAGTLRALLIPATFAPEALRARCGLARARRGRHGGAVTAKVARQHRAQPSRQPQPPRQTMKPVCHVACLWLSRLLLFPGVAQKTTRRAYGKLIAQVRFLPRHP